MQYLSYVFLSYKSENAQNFPGGFAPWTPANALCAASPPPSALGLPPQTPESGFAGSGAQVHFTANSLFHLAGLLKI